MRHPARPGVLLATALLAASGCAGNGTLDATSVLSYDRCQGIDAGLTQVDYAEVAGIRGSTLLDLTGPAPGAEPSAEAGLLLVAISRGRQPTPGYALTLAGAERRNHTAVLTVNWRTPPSGAVLAQVITHPCLVVGLPRDGLARVEAVDQTGTRLGSLSL